MLDFNSKIISIPFGQCFLESLAKLLIEQSVNSLELAQTLVLLPTRRGILNLQETFQKKLNGDSFLMLPRMVALADIESENPLLLTEINDLSPSISNWKRLGLFTQLILKFQPDYTVNRALKAAKSLMHLVDEAETTGIDLLNLETLVAEDYAEHWQTTLGFLKIITHHWPEILKELEVIEPQTRVRQALLALSEHWLQHPPAHRIVIAGTTGTVPATAQLIKTILDLPQGQVVLPGYDEGPEEVRKMLPHPQHTLQNLVLFLSEPPSFTSTNPTLSSSDLIRGSMDSRATTTMESFSENDKKVKETIRIYTLPQPSKLAADRQALIHATMDNSNLDLDPAFNASYFPQMVECDTISEEAKVIALMMRYYLEEITGPITLVSPNQSLCRLVEAELDRWNLVANSSGGTPLNQTVVGSFLLAIADLWANFDVSRLLTVLKHPLCLQGNATLRQNHLENIRHLEKNVLRKPDFDIKDLWELGKFVDPGVKPKDDKGWNEGDNTASVKKEKVSSSGLTRGSITSDWLSTILKALEPFKKPAFHALPLADLLQLHQDIALNLVGGDKDGSKLWQQNDGIAAQEFFSHLLSGHHYFPHLSYKAYPAFFVTLMRESPPVRDYKGIGSRLTILGALEARLSNSEVIILGGLNENSWPPAIDADPWLSRAMRQALGLPVLERRLGLSAHDFCSCFYAKHLLLTRSHSDNGSPTLPSRWWQRLETVRAKNKGLFLSCQPRARHEDPWILGSSPSMTNDDKPWKAWVKGLLPLLEPIKIKPPKPCPPVAIRPTKLSATEIEKLMRDPYSVYAKHCLNLKSLLPLHQPLNPAERGQIIHKILEEHVKIGISPENHLPHLLDRARTYFLHNPISRVFWWHRFEQIAHWFLAKLEEHNIKQCLTEQKGGFSFKVKDHGFEIMAIADRIDSIDKTAIRIVDYKTGTPPSKSDMQSGYSSQLILEALIAAKGGFNTNLSSSCLTRGFIDSRIKSENDIVKEIAIWHLKGGEPAGNIISLAITEDVLIHTETNLLNLLEVFLNDTTPYLACPVPEKAPLHNDYAHLERLLEWS